jgi:hypothetical protein
MEYILVSKENDKEFSRRINELLNDGWKLYGELLVNAYYVDFRQEGGGRPMTIYTQALTKE